MTSVSPAAVRLMSDIAGGIAIAALSITLAVSACSLFTIARTRSAPTIVWCILGTSICTSMVHLSLTVHYTYPWTLNDGVLCSIVSRSVTWFYCMSVAFVVQFLHARAQVVDEDASSTLLMKVIQAGILGVIPLALVGVIGTQSYIDTDHGLCLPYYPIYVPALLTIAVVAMSSLLTFKFVSAIRHHNEIIDMEQPAVGIATIDYRKIARQNLLSSSIAMSCTTATMAFVLINDIIFTRTPAFIMTIEDTVGVIDLTINYLIVKFVFQFSNIRLPGSTSKVDVSQAFIGCGKVNPVSAINYVGGCLRFR
ncbi:unnamed protein product (mitochondrion) [Plasmodiophora brassicae]|uniref:G-protein coupled receptors family 1 profile domain-containing protein n=1 Tax=Plasmodiophora brassicae TaxID=37360 RepID=A0A3P3YKP5_PLABS|nr:unnamed protein product [Plasmodiophora brassicae]